MIKDIHWAYQIKYLKHESNRKITTFEVVTAIYRSVSIVTNYGNLTISYHYLRVSSNFINQYIIITCKLPPSSPVPSSSPPILSTNYNSNFLLKAICLQYFQS